MSSNTATFRTAAAEKWAAAKPVLIGLVVGLIAGPIISGVSGFQMRTSAASAATHTALVEQQAAICNARARAATPNTSALGYQARTDLAKQWSIMPGSSTADEQVVYACSTLLAR